MKLNKLQTACVAVLTLTAATGCDSEKDLIIIDEDLPIKTESLFMLGDATPNGWDNSNPTPLTASEEDPLVYTWSGKLNKGEMKLCLVAGSWDVPFIRPEIAGTPIGREEIKDARFAMHAGDPDDKWSVTEAGLYSLTFNLRNWTMSSHFDGEAEKPAVTPIKAEKLYIVGDATPNGWSIDAPTELKKESEYIFTWSGELKPGEMKACLSTGSWDVDFIRPAAPGITIGRDGVSEPDLVMTAAPDDKWNVTVHGIYALTFDLEHCTLQASLQSEIKEDKKPIESPTLYMIGDATPGGWSMDEPSQFTRDTSNGFIFTWEGRLNEGTLKMCLEPDGTFSCPFIRPADDNVEISDKGVDSPDFIFTTSPDNKWKVTRAGRYRLTIDLAAWTIKAELLD